MDQARWLDETEQAAWRAYQLLRRRLEARIARDLNRDSGLSAADYAVLVLLSETDGHRLRAFELGRELDWEKSRLSHHLTRMERRQLVEKVHCTSDGRGAYVGLTATGMAAITAAAPRHVESVRRHFVDALTRGQLESMVGIATSVMATLADDGGPACDDGGDAACEGDGGDGACDEGGDAVGAAAAQS